MPFPAPILTPHDRPMAHPCSRLLTGIGLSAMLFAGCGADGPTGDVTATDGAAAFASNCASCHGPDLEGTGLGPSLLSEVYVPSHHPDESIRNAVANGVQAHHWDFGPMPAFRLDDATVTAIIAHIRETQTAEGFQPYPPAP